MFSLKLEWMFVLFKKILRSGGVICILVSCHQLSHKNLTPKCIGGGKNIKHFKTEHYFFYLMNFSVSSKIFKNAFVYSGF